MAITLTDTPTLHDVMVAFEPVYETARGEDNFPPAPTLRASTEMLQRLFGPDAPRMGWQPQMYWDWAFGPESWHWRQVITDFGPTYLTYDETIPADTVVIEWDED